jgi:predicted nucleic acid-binding Zn ribbon protein
MIPVPEGGYHCPYCNKQGSPDEWLTEEQARHAEQVAARDLAQPFIQRKAEEMGMSVEPGPPIHVDSLGAEPNDMNVFVFSCHPAEPIKHDADWARPLHCIICGKEASLR